MSASSLRKMIHVGCKQLGLDDETRRDLQLVATGKTSMSDMTEADLQKVVEALKERGFRPAWSAGTGRGRPIAPRKDLRYAHKLWTLLGEAGALKRPGRDGLNAFVRSRFEGKWQSVPIDIDALRDPRQISDVINALKAMCRQAGIQH
ncbi:MAG: phage protein GemA/Gp16 family protein [Pseudodonghicola sp.]